MIMDRVKDELAREFYIKMTKQCGWSKNILMHQIENKTYQQFLTNQTNFANTVAGKNQYHTQPFHFLTRVGSKEVIDAKTSVHAPT